METSNQTGMKNAVVNGRAPRRGRRWRVAGGQADTLFAATLLAAACSAGRITSETAAAQPAGTGTVAGQLLIKGDRDLVSFARCMRAHGVAMSDPYHRPGHAGLTLDMSSPYAGNRAAFAACDRFMRALIQVKQERTVAFGSSELAAITRYAECMRAHDINMLDPTPRGELDLGDVPCMASNGFGRSSPQFSSADAACRYLLPSGVADDGTGP